MSAPLIDDSLVEMVRGAADKVLAEAFGGCFNPAGEVAEDDSCADRECFCARTLDEIARAALAVAVPRVVDRCASAAASVREPLVSGTYVPSFDGPFSRGFDMGRERARDAIRSLTKDTQS